MENMWTLMVFVHRQTQVVVLQYKSERDAGIDAGMLTNIDGEAVIVADDYGRELRISPKDVQLVLLQDIAKCTEGNVAIETASRLRRQELTQQTGAIIP